MDSDTNNFQEEISSQTGVFLFTSVPTVATERAEKKRIFWQDCLGVEHCSAFHGMLPAFEVHYINTL